MKFLLKISKKIPFFFILLLSSIILVPFMEKLKIGVVTILLFSIMPVTGVYSATKAKENRLIILAISIPFTITNLLPLIINKDCPIYDIAGYISIILGILTYGYTICTIMSSIIKPGKNKSANNLYSNKRIFNDRLHVDNIIYFMCGS